jgi:hypothetical protein
LFLPVFFAERTVVVLVIVIFAAVKLAHVGIHSEILHHARRGRPPEGRRRRMYTENDVSCKHLGRVTFLELSKRIACRYYLPVVGWYYKQALG